MTLRLFERLRLSEDDVALTKEWIDDHDRAIELAETECDGTLTLRAQRSSHLFAILAYLREDEGASLEYASKSMRFGMDYLFGNWRLTFPSYDSGKADPQWWYTDYGWVEPLRLAGFWAIVLQDWDTIEKLGTYPEPGGFFRTEARSERAFEAWVVILAGMFRGASISEFELWMEVIVKSRSKREKLLLKLLQSTLAGSDEEVLQELCCYMKYFSDKEFTSRKIPDKFAIDARIVLGLAERSGRQIEIPAEFQDHFVRFRG